MINKKLLSAFFLIFGITGSLFAQTLTEYKSNNYPGAMIDRISSSMDKKTNYNGLVDISTMKGSPYEVDGFQVGKAVNKLVGKPKSYYMRYNVYNDVIELKETQYDPNIVGLIESSNIYAIINNVEYHYEQYTNDSSVTKEGYFILLYKGNNSSLFLKKTKKVKEAVVATDSYHSDTPAAFIDLKSYYFKKNNVLSYVPLKKKELLLQYSDQAEKLKKYIKSQKLNLKNQEDLIKLFKYYDTLLK